MSSRSIFWGRYNCSAKKNEAVPPRGARCAPRRERHRSAPALPPARGSATTALRCEGEQRRLASTSTAGKPAESNPAARSGTAPGAGRGGAAAGGGRGGTPGRRGSVPPPAPPREEAGGGRSGAARRAAGAVGVSVGAGRVPSALPAGPRSGLGRLLPLPYPLSFRSCGAALGWPGCVRGLGLLARLGPLLCSALPVAEVLLCAPPRCPQNAFVHRWGFPSCEREVSGREQRRSCADGFGC